MSEVDHDRLLAEVVAHHFDEARICDDGTVDLGFGDFSIQCVVNRVADDGSFASLYFYLSGGALGDVPVFASAGGYASNAKEAIISGACTWTCTFGPVLRTVAAGGSPAPDADCEVCEVEVHGQRFRAAVSGYDRCVGMPDGATDEDVGARTLDARTRYGGDMWIALAPETLSTLPLLSTDQASVIGVFVFDMPGREVLEVKVHGRNWAPANRRVEQIAPATLLGGAMLRELAVLTPMRRPPPLTRTAVEATLAGLEQLVGDDDARALTAWPGWRAHGGRLGKPASARDIAALEADIGPLPGDYRDFVTTVAADGAGPGYGLLSPLLPRQRPLARGAFAPPDGATDDGMPGGCLALGHAGCGIMWLLVLNGESRGQVWVDGRSSGGAVRRVADSFDDWYRGWLDAATRGAELWVQWDPKGCAIPQLLSNVLRSIEEDGVSGDGAAAELPNRVGAGTVSSACVGDGYFDHGAPLAPCRSCVYLTNRFGLTDEVFASGTEFDAAPAKRGLFGRIGDKLRGR